MTINPIGNWRKDTQQHLLCPRCHANILPLGYPGALSRTDNKTEICSPCGMQEAMEDWLKGGHQAQSAWPVKHFPGSGDAIQA